MGRRKFKLRHIKNAEKRGVVAISRAKVFVEGLTLSLPSPEIISLQPVKACMTMVMTKLQIIQ